MIVVRYATLAALVFWLAAMLGVRCADLFRRVDLVTYACGAATVVGLFVMKFMGPPPAAFVPRAAIAALMLALSVGSAFVFPPEVSAMVMTVNIALGFVLLIWYVRE
jgi:hypothetical protein